ncbi:MAG: hypothetical protein RLZ35_901 [Pseudomonadota bacterium]|jgi:hypothetical protein
MNKKIKQSLQVGTALKKALALWVWQFKDKLYVLAPIVLLQIYAQYNILTLLGKFSSPNEPQVLGIFFKILAWYLSSSVILFMGFTDITRRLCGYPFEASHLGVYLNYVYWLFKKALTLLTLMMTTVIAGILSVVAIAFVLGFVLQSIGMPLTAEPPLWLSVTLMVLGLSLSIILIAHCLLISFPLVVDRNQGPIQALLTSFSRIKPYRHYAYQMGGLLLMIAVLPNMVMGSVATFFAVKPGMSFVHFVTPAFISTALHDLVGVFLLCLQLAVYQQLQAEKKV